MKIARSVSPTVAPAQTRKPRTSAVLKPIVAVLLATGLAAPVHAIDTVWLGGLGDWNTAANWSLGIPGAGDVAIINAGTATQGLDASILGLTQGGGTIGGIGNLTVTGASTWTAGTQSGAAATNFSSTLAISGAGGYYIYSGRIVNASNTTWSGNTGANNGDIFFNNGTFNNTGSFTDSNAFANQVYGSGTFNNAGTYNKQSNTLTNVSSVFNNTGTVNVNAGTMQVASALTNNGLINIAAGATFLGSNATFVNAGTLSGDGTVATHLSGDIVNQGTINPGSAVGLLTLDGDLNQTATGVLNFELASLANFDVLSVTDDVTLDGNIVVWNAGYNPVVGDSFVVLTFDARLGGSIFDTVSTQGYGAGVVFKAVYNPHDVTLQVVAVPEPETYAMLLAGLGLVGFVVRRRAQRAA